ncbi:MAG: transcription-repair coupling factor [Candidatus Latescibacterota bacterium]|nr:MAG: transcription-repair coupling factor [Candidatus Latescibacterota bacterium]
MLDRLLSRAAQEDLLRQLLPKSNGGVFTSLSGSSASLMAALLFRERPTQTLVIAPKLDDAEGLAHDLATLLPDHPVLFYPEFEILPYDSRSPYKGITGQQVEVLHHVLSGEMCVVVTSAKGLKWKIQPPEEIVDYTLRFSVGEEIDYEATMARFAEMGYYAVPRVESPGDFARKGGILDVFSVSYENPLRIELFGDEIESIRFFDATTQRSLEQTTSALVPPCSPLILSPDNVSRAEAAVRSSSSAKPEERARLEDSIRERLHFEGMERYAAYYSQRVLLTECFLDQRRMIWVQPESIVEQMRRLESEIHKLHHEAARAGHPVPEPSAIYAPNDALAGILDEVPTLYFTDIHLGSAPRERLLEPLQESPVRARSEEGEEDDEEEQAGGTAASATSVPSVRLHVQSPGEYGGRVPDLRRDLERRLTLGQRIHVFCDNEGQAERLRELLDDLADRIDFPVGELQAGFVLVDHDVVVLTDREIFQRYKRRQRRRKYRISQGVSAYEELSPGDFVVHVNYGIARYLGIQKITVEGSEIDCLQLLFAGGDRIYVTVDQLNMVEKYVGKEGVAPQLSKLGTNQWERTKERAKRAIAEMAQELLELAAIRQARRGHAYSPDSHLLRELEASFIYDETEDQLTTIQDVKEDMEKAVPMDRLVCGDVGYGKTEVAVRAAFKSVVDNKQVAVLVPTTILAQQHLNTFQERLADFPVNVEMVSRLRSAREQKKILERVSAGQVDILIGTHRLLSKDVEFKSLGLVVVDEEHRFGVAHKEKLKRFKETVDVMSMTATPIPRTLHMALIGLREMSLINTAPRDRLPVQTEILPFDEEVIVDALMRELDRGGQVYFVHNRVQSIDAMAGYVRRIMPTARVAVAHGQMQERQLEKVMLDFLDQKYDVLVSTMIIESGLDIPSVNTLIVNRADRLGLAQLYQLRGRVGRSTHKAYAYFLVPRVGRTTDLARKRLAALQEFEALGSGLRVAMRDMEIRGAGNILGPQQHGQLAAVGFDLYCRLLEQTGAELQGRETAEEISTRVEVDLDYRIPDAYVPDPEEKMRVYKRVAAALAAEELGALRGELRDRFGALPEPAANLLQIAEIRVQAHRAGVDRVRVRKGRADLDFRPGRSMSRDEIEALVRGVPNKLGFDAAQGFRIIQHLRPGDRLAQVVELLDQLNAAHAATGTV